MSITNKNAKINIKGTNTNLEETTSGKKLRVFEAFAGIGAQAAAFKRMNINYEIVGISDWFIDAIECYAAIHCKDKKVTVPQDIKEVDEYLSKFTFSADSVKPYDIKRLTEDQRRDLYRANKKANNYGSITELKGCDMPETDLLVYSFPCQDLSTGGLGKGMKKGSGTRSGLLWEIERILKELNALGRLPEYLLLENVKTIKASTNIEDLNQWLAFLESIGYQNDDCMILNSLDFGVPQDRERAFIISHLGNKLNLNDIIAHKKKPRVFDIYDFIMTDYDSDPALRTEADTAQLNKTPSRDVMWDINGIDPITSETTVRTITCNMDRTHTAALFKYDGIKGDTYRRLTLREAFLLMGFYKLIWDTQSVPSCLDADIAGIAKTIFDTIYDENRPTANIETYCKREECWIAVQKKVYELSDECREALITPAQKEAEAVVAKKEQKFSTGIDNEIGIFNKGTAYWQDLITRGKSQDVLSYSDIKALNNAINYCNLVYTALSARQVKEILSVVIKLKENGIE